MFVMMPGKIHWNE